MDLDGVKKTLIEILKIGITHLDISNAFMKPLCQMIKLCDKKFKFEVYTIPESDRVPISSGSRIDMFNLLYTDIPQAQSTDKTSVKMKRYFDLFNPPFGFP